MASWQDIDFSPLANLGKTYQDAQMKANRERTLAQLGQGASANDVATSLFKIGDLQGGLSLAQLGNAQAQQDWNRTYQGGMLDVARQNVEPEVVKSARAAGYTPGTPEWQRAVSPKSVEQPISITEKKMITTAEDDIPRLQQTISNVARAKELNKDVFTGLGTSLRARAGNVLPDMLVPDFIADKEGSKKTVEWDQIMGQEAIQLMADTLKGASTDFEMRKFLGIAANTELPADVRERAMDRFTSLANAELDLRKRRASEMRSGTYFKPGNDPTGKPQPVPDKPTTIPRAATEALMANPKLRAAFDAKYGPGSAATVLDK